MRKGERRDEAADDDVHDDVHVHVPHEHALLCQSSLRFSINADRIENQFPVPRRTMRKLHRRDELPFILASSIVQRGENMNHAILMAQCNRESRRM